MKRREFLLMLTAAVAAARGLRAQQKAMPVVGELSALSAANPADRIRGPIHQGNERNGLCRGPEYGVGVPLGRRPL